MFLLTLCFYSTSWHLTVKCASLMQAFLTDAEACGAALALGSTVVSGNMKGALLLLSWTDQSCTCDSRVVCA